MAKRVEVSTQDEFDAVVKIGDIAVVRAGFFEAGGSSHVEAWGISHVKAWGSSHVEAWGSSHVVARESSHVEAWGSSHVEAWGSSHVVAGGSSHVVAGESSHVVAGGGSHVEAWGSSHVEAGGTVMLRLFSALKITASFGVIIAKHGEASEGITGGQIIDCPVPDTPEAWCEYYGVPVMDGVAVLFKGVNAEFQSEHGFDYTPGTIPVAPDWDGGKKECGGGLHFSPHPEMTREFCSPERFLACPVALVDMRAPKHGDTYPAKIKARGCAAPIWEVDRLSKPIATTLPSDQQAAA